MSKILLVEGVNDYHVVGALCRAYSLPKELFTTENCGGDGLALKRLNALIESSEQVGVIGLLLDADRPDVAGRWQSIQHKLRLHPYQLPPAPSANGTIILPPAPELPKLGFWLMPNNQDAGMLEDFIKEMMPADCILLIERYLAQEQLKGCVSYKEAHQSKAIVHTYLAWQDEPGRPIGQAITAKTLVPDTGTATEFTNWLRNLFD